MTIVSSLSSCKLYTDCPNNLSDYLTDFFPYQDGDTVHYLNDTLGEIVDTVLIFYYPPEEQYSDDASDAWRKCSGVLTMAIKNYFVTITQLTNEDNNEIVINFGFFNYELQSSHYYYVLKDSLDYNYNNTTIRAYRYDMNTNTGFYSCTSFIIAKDYTLLQYTQKKDGEKYIWRLK